MLELMYDEEAFSLGENDGEVEIKLELLKTLQTILWGVTEISLM